MKKEEYIAKFGEEAYKERLEKRRIYMKEYYKKNSEKFIEQVNKWRKKNPEKLKENQKKWAENSKPYKKKYREEHKQQISEAKKKCYESNKEHYLEYNRKYRNKHKEEIKLLFSSWRENNPKKYRASQIVGGYNNADKIRGFDIVNNVDSNYVVEKIFTSKCIYCGDSDWTHLGCDRIDNSKPHTPDNVVCACGVCNMERIDRYTVEEFKKYRSLHPRSCDLTKKPSIQLTESGALKKREI